ncbi:MAG: hypothetical protein ACK2UO_13410 [Caldilineaceae bacterium]
MSDRAGTRPSFLHRAPGRTHTVLWVIIGMFVVLAAVYSVVVPPFETPDEIWHFAFVQALAEGEGLPVSEANTQAMWRQQGVQAPGYYIAAAAITGWIDQSDFPGIFARANPHAAIGEPGATSNRNYLVHHRDENWPWTGSILALHITRLFSIALGAITLWASYQAVAPVIGVAQALGGLAVFAFIPQFIFISAAASNDNAVNALVALVLWRLVTLVVRPEPGLVSQYGAHWRRDFLILGLLLGLALLSKLSALGLVGLTGLAVFYCAWRVRSLRPVLEAILWIGIPVAAIAGWWYVRNWRLYGDPLAWNIWESNILLRVDTASWRAIAAEFTSLERSFWGLFGWLNLAYPEAVYLLLRAILLLIVVGCALALVRWFVHGRKVEQRWLGGLLLLAWLMILTISWLRFMRIAPAAQGRYFFPAAPTLVLLIAVGLQAWRVWTLNWLVGGLMLALSIATPFWIIVPAYQPAVSANVLGEDAAPSLTPISANLGDHFAILGVGAIPDHLQPGQEATVLVKWRARKPATTDYSVFVHLVDENGLIIAQQDTMPGSGLYPTSEWLTDETRIETYTVEIPTGAYTPNRGSWVVGMYDSATGERLPVLPGSTAVQPSDVELLADSVRFGEVVISTPPGSVPNPLDARFRDNMTLKGYELSSRQLIPGEELQILLYWTARGSVAQDYVSFVHLLDADQNMVAGHDDRLDPVTSTWSTGETLVDRHSLIVPESAVPGVYHLEVGLYTRPDFDRLQLETATGAEGADRLLLGPLQVSLR